MGAGSTAALAAFDHLIRTPDPAAAKKEEAELA
jgi:alkyl hydroperoxide reductase subunit F